MRGAAAVISLQEEQPVQEDFIEPRAGRSAAEHNAWMRRVARRKEEQERADAAGEYERRQRVTSSSSGASGSGGLVNTGARKKTFGSGRSEVESKPSSAQKVESKPSSAQRALPEVMAMVKVFAPKRCLSHAEYL